MSQYSNKTVFWFMKTFCFSNNVNLRCIYLESGHGMDVHDALGTTVKQTIGELIDSNPDLPVYDVG